MKKEKIFFKKAYLYTIIFSLLSILFQSLYYAEEKRTVWLVLGIVPVFLLISLLIIMVTPLANKHEEMFNDKKIDSYNNPASLVWLYIFLPLFISVVAFIFYVSNEDEDWLYIISVSVLGVLVLFLLYKMVKSEN